MSEPLRFSSPGIEEERITASNKKVLEWAHLQAISSSVCIKYTVTPAGAIFERTLSILDWLVSPEN